MAFKLAWLVELLQSLDDARRQKAVSTSRNTNPDEAVVAQWFRRYDSRIVRTGTSAMAFLSCLFPERVPRRSYAMREKRLSAIFGRALGLGTSRAKRLNAWQERRGADFASCVEAVMAECENDPPSPGREVTLEEVNLALLRLAANSTSSAPEVRGNQNGQSMDQLLAPILRRLQGYEAKWLIRMIFKSYAPVVVPERAALAHFHFLLPDILAVQDSLEAAVVMLGSGHIAGLASAPEKKYITSFREAASRGLRPQLGIMIKRQPYDKARSIKHCCTMADNRIMSVERKYDGEYCQIHIDRSCRTDPIQVFSKSGKDSTQDRIRLHGAIKDALALDRKGCKIRNRCVLEGELMIWNSLKKDFEPFHKIREHVMYGGRPLGRTSTTSPPRSERVMIMFYDILLLDDKFVALEPHSQRRQLLKGLIKCISGSSSICERVLIDFGSSKSPTQLQSAFAQCIRKGWEGFVLKGNSDPYVSFRQTNRCIKLKKDYITGLGETGDLCLIGASRNSRIASELSLIEGVWTDFHAATLENKDGVCRFKEKPIYKIIDTMNPKSMSRCDLLTLNARAVFLEVPFSRDSTEMTVQLASKAIIAPTILFKKPVIVEVMGAGFDKNLGCNHYVLRFPRLTKLHFDRGIEDVMGFEQLQEMAEASIAAGSDDEAKEDAKWIERLHKADGKGSYVTDQSQSTSPGMAPRSLTTISLSPVSSRKPQLPPLIRVDSAEMTTQELLDPRQHSQKPATGTTTTTLTTLSIGSKRNPQQVDPTPIAKTMRKRHKASSPPCPPLVHELEAFSTPERPRLSADKLPPSSSSPRLETLSSRKARCIVKTPRWGQGHRSSSPTVPPSDPPADFGSSPTRHQQTTSKAEASLPPRRRSKEIRKPLAEMTNVSPQLSRRTLPHPPRTESSPDSKLQFHHQEGNKRVVAVEKPRDAAPQIFPFLHTPLINSEESAAAEKISNLEKTIMQSGRGEILATISGTESEEVSLKPRPRQVSCGPWNWPMYIPPSLATSPNLTPEDLMILMRRIDATFTFSSSTFMAQIFKYSLPGQRWVVLVDGESCSLDGDLFSCSPTGTARQSLFPLGGVPTTDSAATDSHAARPPSSPELSSPSSITARRPSTSSTILSIGQELAQILSRSSYTDTMEDVIPPAHLQAVDVLFFDYHVLAIDMLGEHKEDPNPSVVGQGGVPWARPLGLSSKPSLSVPRLPVLGQAAEQERDFDSNSDIIGGRTADEPWSEMFVAGLRYSNDIRDERGKRAIKVIWDWNEMMGRRRQEDKPRGKGKATDGDHDEDQDGDDAVSGKQALDRDLLKERYERMAEQRAGGENHDMDNPSHGFPEAPTSPRCTEEGRLAQQFWERMRQRDEQFQEELATEKYRQATTPASKTR